MKIRILTESSDTCKMYYVGDDNLDALFDERDDGYELMDQAEYLFSNSGINISRNEELYEICVDSETVLGATVVSETYDHDHDHSDFEEPHRTVRFSVAVDPSARRKGIARNLIQNIINSFQGSTIEAWVVNPHMVPLLESLGFDGYNGPDDPFMTLYT